jgi:parallel beta-helix repeat protein
MQNKWTIRHQSLSANTTAPSASYPFYVEGKLWMLDSPNEWAVANGRLYVWPADGLSPEGRVWVSSQSDSISASGVSSAVSDLTSLGINANNSSGIIIDSVQVFGASDGISANNSTNLQVLNTDVTNSFRDGIFASGSKGLSIRNSTFQNSGRNGIGGWYSSAAIIAGNVVSTSGFVAGMPRATQGGIFFGYTSTNILIDSNKVSNSGYNGITAHISSTVKNNTVDGACSTLADGGGIYTNGRTSGVALKLRIEGNVVSNVSLDGSKGIYLDDESSYVTVVGNTVFNTRTGLFIHDGHDNIITSNQFRSNINHHLAMATTASNNKVTNNMFNSTRGELTYALEGSTDLTTFGSFDFNTYASTDVSRFASAGGIKSYSSWKTFMKQDANSTMNGVP